MGVRLDYYGKVIPKLRPRFNSKISRAYNPPNYQEWKEDATRDFTAQWFGRETLSKCHITIIICGKHNADPDNLAGAILDALVQGKILKDDKITNIPDLRVVYHPYSQIGVTVLIEAKELGDNLHDFKR